MNDAAAEGGQGPTAAGQSAIRGAEQTRGPRRSHVPRCGDRAARPGALGSEASILRHADGLQVERKTIAFVDCCGFSAYTRRYGDQAAVGVHLQLRAAVERCASAAEVTVVKWLGDGAMLAADGPTTVLACLSETIVAAYYSSELPIRAGLVHGGVAALECDGVDYVGGVVNLAAELCAEAGPWEVHADEGTGRRAIWCPLGTGEPSASPDRG